MATTAVASDPPDEGTKGGRVSRRKTKRPAVGRNQKPELRDGHECHAPFFAVRRHAALCPTRSFARARSRLFGFMIIEEHNGSSTDHDTRMATPSFRARRVGSHLRVLR